MEQAQQQVQDFTGAPPGQALAALQATGGNVQTAVEMLLEGVVFPEPAGGGGGARGCAAPRGDRGAALSFCCHQVRTEPFELSNSSSSHFQFSFEQLCEILWRHFVEL